jgi:hypothetical protein
MLHEPSSQISNNIIKDRTTLGRLNMAKYQLLKCQNAHKSLTKEYELVNAHHNYLWYPEPLFISLAL